jgi:hypothetical protein
MENSKIVMVLWGITTKKTERKTSQHCSEAKKKGQN